jgi:hypothetical protein
LPKPLRAQRRKVEETTATTFQQSVRADYTPGNFVAVGVETKKGAQQWFFKKKYTFL